MQGTFEIWEGFFSRWTKYHFQIYDQTLMFGPTKDQMHSRVHLKVAQAVTTVDDPITFIIYTGTETLTIRTNSIEERVRLFKKIKHIQKQAVQANYHKEMSSLDRDLGRNNKVKALEQLTVQLWQSHADLQNIIEEISLRVKGPTNLKSLTDKLRITVQSIKLKNTEALKIIEDQIASMSRNSKERNYFAGGSEASFSQQSLSIRENDTKYLSFDEIAPKSNLKTSNKPKNGYKSNGRSSQDQFRDTQTSNMYPPELKTLNRNSKSDYYSFDNPNDNMRSMNDSVSEVEAYQSFSKPKMVKRNSATSQNELKNTLVETNPVFIRYRTYITSAPYRSILPEKFTPEEKFPIMSVLSGAGSDLTRFSFPVTVNEPLSMLQKGCEQMYYSKLLDQADKQDLPELRALYVAAFVVSKYSLSEGRTKKPFNPLLGETFQFMDQERGFEFISEQVSHHPPISAVHCRSDHYQLLESSKTKSSFSGTSIKVTPESKGKIILQLLKDEYTFNKCTMSLNNLMVGKLYMEFAGQVVIVCKKFNTRVVLKFKQQSFWGKDGANNVEGELFKNGESLYLLRGKWNQNLVALRSADKKQYCNLWQKRHVNNPQYYNFSEFTILLNHLNRANFHTIAPTDSRLRPDQRALELQDLKLAASEKKRLEQKQRRIRTINEQTNRTHQVLWFNKETDEQGQEVYVSNELYWQERRRGIWTECLDIFGP